MRANTIVMLLLALVFGAAAVFMSQSWLQSQAEKRVQTIVTEAQPSEPVARSTIVVAARAMRFGAEVTADGLKEIPWPADAMPPGGFRTVGDVFAAPGRRVALAGMVEGEPVLVGKLSGPGQRATLSSVIDADMKAVTVRVDDVAGVAGFVLPGDRVDVLITRRQGEEGDPITETVADRVRVLAVDQSFDTHADKPSVPRAVTIEVAAGVAQSIAFASAAGTVSLALRRAGEAEAPPAAAARLRPATVSVSRATKRQDYAVRSED